MKWKRDAIRPSHDPVSVRHTEHSSSLFLALVERQKAFGNWEMRQSHPEREGGGESPLQKEHSAGPGREGNRGVGMSSNVGAAA